MCNRLIESILLLFALGAQAGVIRVGDFDSSKTEPQEPWQVVRLAGISPTRFNVRLWDGVTAIEAVSQASMALLARPLTINLRTHPVLCWRWRIDQVVPNAELGSRAGDDYAARIYIGLDLPPQSLTVGQRARLAVAHFLYSNVLPDAALNYVWDNRQPIGSERVSAYTEQVKMIVLQSGNHLAGQWRSERRDALKDARRLFQVDIPQVTMLAVASDTDNTRASARAGFADLHFVPESTSCSFTNAGDFHD